MGWDRSASLGTGIVLDGPAIKITMEIYEQQDA